MSPQFKHIYFHTGRQLWQAVHRERPSVSHKDEQGCARAAAKLWGVPYASLFKSKPRTALSAQVPTRNFKHVTWHASKKVWVVMDGSKYVGCSKEMPKAVQIAKKHFKRSSKTLRLRQSVSSGSNRVDFCKRFALLHKVYQGRPPHDLEDLLSSAKRVAKTISHRAKTSAMLVPYFVSKFPSHRQAVLKVIDEHRHAPDTYSMLVDAATRIAKIPLSDAAVRNIGRKNMHHGTFAMFASGQLGLLSKTKLTKDKHILIGKGAVKYKILHKTQRMLNKIACLYAFGKKVEEMPPPRSISDWMDCVKSLDKIAKVAPGISNNYRRCWVVRCSLIVRMRNAGIKSLRVGQCSVRDFQGLFPDQKSLLVKAAGGSHMLHRKMSDILSDCAYRGPPELFTMWACLFSDRAVASVSLDWLSRNEQTLKSTLEDLLKTDKVMPHPGVLVEEVKRRLP